MSNLAKKLNDDSAVQEIGTVALVDDTQPGACSLLVTTSRGDYRARRALSCLLAPVVGDRVLLASTEAGSSWVLAVLERDGDEAPCISADGDLSVRLPRGRFTVAAESVEMVASKDVSLTSTGLRVHAKEGNLVLHKLSVLGRYVVGEFEKVKTVAASLDQVLDRFSQRVDRSYRNVTGYDSLRAEQVDYRAKRTMSLHAENAVVTAEELIKMDGEQIHIG